MLPRMMARTQTHSIAGAACRIITRLERDRGPVKRLVRKLLLHLPSHHRRRQWKYVSPRRRVVGLLVLALILLLLYAGWYFTHDSRIRRQAKLALEGLTGADVDVDAAQFSFFEGVRLQNVRVRIREDNAPFHFFTAREVVLRYEPWTLLTKRTLEPTEIVCIEPVVNLEHDEDTGVSNAERLFRQAASRTDGQRLDQLPLIQLTDGLLRSRVKQGRQRSIVTEERIDCTFRPTSPHSYNVTVRGPHGTQNESIWAEFGLDLARARLTDVEFIGTSRLFMLLPPRYHDWLDRYEVAGDFELLDEGYTDPDRDRYEIALRGFSLRLPEDEGELALENVTGRLRFSPEGVVLEDIRGVVPQAGGARFELQGEYGGLTQDSPFMVTVTIHDFSLPDVAEGQIGEIVDFMRRHFQPQGKASLSLKYQRMADGDFAADGEIRPQGLTMTPDWFPVQVTDVTGRVTFDEQENYVVDLAMQRPGGEPGQLRATGTVRHPGPDRRSVYDITVRGRDVPLDADLREALPERFRGMWDRFSPAGVANARVRAYKPSLDEPMGLDVDLLLTGKASARYKNFPYPLRNLTGRIELRGDRVAIPLVESERGKTLVQIRGTADGLGGDASTVAINIDARRVMLDEALREALPERARQFVEDFHARGQARRVTARISGQPGQPVRHDVTAELADVAFRSEAFDYPVTGAAGELRVTPEEVQLQELTGHHGEATVRVDATVSLDEDAPTYLATLHAQNVALDEAFYEALPETVQDTWQQLNPGGRADLKLNLADSDGDGQLDEDYRLVLTARDMSILCRDFPYPFRGITGRAVATPGRIVLEDLEAHHDRMTARLSGTISTQGPRDQMVLSASIEEMTIDQTLLDAIPADLVPLVDRFREGGRMNAEISKLSITRGRSAVRNDGDEPATLSEAVPAAGPKSDLQWVAEGSLAFRDVNFDIGFGDRALTGVVAGKAGQRNGQLGLNAKVRLETIELGQREIKDVRGVVMKLPDSDVLRIDDIEGRAHDGVVVGQASIRLDDPVTYKLSIEFEDVDLAKLFNAGEPDKSKWMDVKGRVAGPLVFSASAGENPTRQAVGELVIRDAKLYELPVILGALQIIYLQLPGEGAFNAGTVKYSLRDDTLTFQEIYLTGKSISVLGSGTYDLQNDALKLTFLTGPPGKLQRLDELTEDVLRALSNTLVEIRVSGPLKNPKMDTVPLSPLETILQRLLSPSLQSQ